MIYIEHIAFNDQIATHIKNYTSIKKVCINIETGM